MPLPNHSPKKVQYGAGDFEREVLSDFSGGLNITDPGPTLPKNQFTSFYNFFFNRKAAINARPPFRPYWFQTNAADRHVEVDISGARYLPTTIHDYQVFRENIANWSYNKELHVISGIFTEEEDGATTRLVVAVYCNVIDDWIAVFNDDTATAVSVCSYKINEAFDLLLFPNDCTNENPQRWSPDATADYYTISDLGLIKPLVTGFDVAYAEKAQANAIDCTDGQEIYYKFSYFYDGSGTTTKYGESATQAMTGAVSHTWAAAGASSAIKLTFTDNTTFVPSGVTKIRIYRAPNDSASGPYKYIGETIATTAPNGAGAGVFPTFTDDVPWGEEGIEDLQSGSNPSLSGSALNMSNVCTIGSYLVGFDADMPYKLIWCDSGYPDVWNPLNYDYLNDTGRAAIEFNRKLYVFTKTSVYEKADISSSAIKVSNIGCIDGRSLQDVGAGLIWQDYDTVYFADFVQQYGSKGDFPKDIGDPLSKSLSRVDAEEVSSSAFFDRRYYICFNDTDDHLYRTYVFDVDIAAWTQMSVRHVAWARGDTTLYSLGIGNSMYWVYEHDYTATVAIVSGFSSYEGKDYHDWESISESFWDLINESDTLAWWKCNDNLASQTVLDALDNKTGGGSHNGTTGTRNTNTISGTGQIDRSLDFKTLTDYVEVADHADFNFASSAFSISAWVFIDTGAAGDEIILSKYNTAHKEWLFGIDADEKLFLRIYDDSANCYIQALTDVAISVDTFVHVVGTYDGVDETGINLYVNNVAVAITRSDSGTFVSVEDKDAAVRIAGDVVNGASWNGELDNIILFSKELDTDEVGYVYNYPRKTGMLDITCYIGRKNIKLAGEYRKIFISSFSIVVEAVNLDSSLVISGDAERFSVTKDFIDDDMGTGSVEDYPAVYDTAEYAAGTLQGDDTDTGDADEAGFAGFKEGQGTLHKKINRVMKTEDVKILFTTSDARDLKFLLLVMYYKTLPFVA